MASSSTALPSITIGESTLTIKLDEPLGSNVYKAKWDTQDAAVKIMPKTDQAILNQEYIFLGVCASPYVVKAFGYHCDLSNSFLVTEQMDLSLGKLLESRTLTQEQLYKIALGIACGLEAIHVSDIIHRDIKPDNILLRMRGDEVAEVKLADLGLATDTTTTPAKANLGGTPDFMAPENCIIDEVVTPASDIFNFGITMLVMKYGLAILDQDQNAKKFFDALCRMQFDSFNSKEYPEFKKSLPAYKNIHTLAVLKEAKNPDKYLELMTQCTHYEAKDRPTTTQVIERLKAIMAEEKIEIPTQGSPPSSPAAMDSPPTPDFLTGPRSAIPSCPPPPLPPRAQARLRLDTDSDDTPMQHSRPSSPSSLVAQGISSTFTASSTTSTSSQSTSLFSAPTSQMRS